MPYSIQNFVANIAAVPTALYKLEQGSADRNDILMNITTSHFINGVTMTLKDALFIRQATTERAGAMRAQQVADLNSTRTGLASLQKTVSSLSDVVGKLETTVSENGELLNRVDEVANYCSEGIADLTENLQVTNDDLAATQKSVEENARGISSIKKITDCPRIATSVINGKLQIYNYRYYIQNGYYAFVFRLTSKRNRCSLQNFPEKRRGNKHKGWHVIGGLPNNVKFDSNGFALFRTSPLDEWHDQKDAPFTYAYAPDYIIGVKDTADKRYVPWGKKKVKLANNRGNYMMRRFRFAIGFGKSYERDIAWLSPGKLASNLAEFTVIFDPLTEEFHFGK